MDSHDIRDAWADRTGAYSPAYYAHHGPDRRSDRVLDALTRYLDTDAAVLELGCSSGRHLAHLLDNGFETLSGIDINDEAFEVMADAYPALAEVGTFHCGAFEDLFDEFEADRFDAVYSVETLQHVPPEREAVFADVARVTDDLLVTVENEGDAPATGTGVSYVDDEVPLYYRDWGRVFTGLGLTEVEVTEGDRDTARVFRAVD